MTQHPIEGVKLLILDLDDTVRRCTVPGQPCPNKPGEQQLIPGTREILESYWRAGIPIAVATNQGGVGLGYMTEDSLKLVLAELGQLLGRLSESIGPWGYCPHKPTEGCFCRKPEPGMLLEAMKHHRVSREATLYVGDRDSDKGAAEAAGCRFLWAWEFNPAAKPREGYEGPDIDGENAEGAGVSLLDVNPRRFPMREDESLGRGAFWTEEAEGRFLANLDRFSRGGGDATG